ncbi:hypothetical protein D3C73_1447980 [compost metagenome]
MMHRQIRVSNLPAGKTPNTACRLLMDASAKHNICIITEQPAYIVRHIFVSGFFAHIMDKGQEEALNTAGV